MDKQKFDVIVIGAGAAGLMTAIAAARNHLKVLLLDSREKVGAKILMSGGTRCNVTNVTIEESDYESTSSKLARNILRGFTSQEVIEFFESLGVEFVVEQGGKYFPATHSGKTILDALLKSLEQEKVTLQNPCKVTEVIYKNNVFAVSGDGFSFESKSVVVTTGGLSYPQSGSDGFGYQLAESFGHKLIPTIPALTPLTTEDEVLKSLSGISTKSSRLTFWLNGKIFKTYEGPFLFTHFGFSGPAILNISRHWLRFHDKHTIKITVDFLPQHSTDEFKEMFISHQFAKKIVKNFLGEYFPESFIMMILQKVEVDGDIILSQFSRHGRAKIIEAIKSFDLPVSGAVGYSKAEVTAGGVDLKELNSKTLESKFQKGLFFAGEVLDVDGRIGGFNFQWAWSSAVAVARGLTNSLSPKE